MTSTGYWRERFAGLELGSCPTLAPLLARGWSLRYLRQVHGPRVLTDESFSFCAQEGDGLVSKKQKLALIIRTADCVPIHLWDGTQIAMLHAGWRSLYAGILDALPRDFAFSQARAVIGPAICTEHYEVGPDLYSSWIQDEPSLEIFLKPGIQDKRFLDLKGWTRHLLLRKGLAEAHIRSIPTCTFDSQLPSYRRQGAAASRIINYIALDPEITGPSAD